MVEPISFQATVASVKTLVDGGLRISFDLQEDAILQAAQLMECKRIGILLKIIVEAEDDKKGEIVSRTTAKKRKSESGNGVQ